MKTIVLIDDNVDLAQVLQGAFTDIDFEVFTNPLAAMNPAWWRLTTPAAAIVDLMMPKANGLVMLDWLKLWVPEVRRICFTGYGDEQAEAKALADFYIVKGKGNFIADLERAIQGG